MLEGFLGDDELRTIEAHLDGCAGCMQLVVDLAGGAHAQSRPLQRIGRYEVLERLGSGGQGLVVSAFDPDLQRRVAIKVVRPDRVPEPARLQREARLLASLSHANVMPVFEVGPWHDGLYLVTELGGDSLRSWVDVRRPWREVVAVWLGVGAGLSAAHGAGLVHRDLKPDNVVLHPDGRPLLTDFGLASSALTPEGSGGTPMYLAPELVDGATANARSDQFALCVGLFETLAGRPPFAGSTLAELAASARTARPRPIPGLPSRVHAVVARGLAPQPEDRFESVEALCDALRRAAERRAWPARLATGALGAGGVFAVAAVGLAGAMEWSRSDPRSVRPAAVPVASPRTPTPTASRAPAPNAAPAVVEVLARQCDAEAAKLTLKTCTDEVCTGNQIGRVLGVTECYARAWDCEAYHHWFDRLAAVEPKALVPMLRGSNAMCPPRAADTVSQLYAFLRWSPGESAQDGDGALGVGEQARAWAAHEVATADNVEGLWHVQLNAVRMLRWHGDETAAVAEAERAAEAFARPLPRDLLP